LTHNDPFGLNDFQLILRTLQPLEIQA